MKTIPSAIFLIACLFLTACQSDQKEAEEGTTIGSLFLSDATPNPGSNLQISYKAEADAKEAEVQGYYYYLVNTEIYPQDVVLKDSSGVFSATVSIPDSATAIGFNFKVNENFDTNGKKGFVMPLFDEEGKLIPGAKASEGFYYLNVGSQTGLEMEKDSVLSMVRSDLKQHPKLKSSWDAVYARLLYGSDATNGKSYIDERIAFYAEKSNLSEDEYTTLIGFQRILQNKEKMDSLQKVVLEKYPKGKMAQRHYFMDFRQTKNLAEQEEMLTQYDTKFDEKEPFKNAMLRMLANAYLAQDNLDKFMAVSDKISDNQTKASLYNNAAWGMAEKGNDLETAAKMSKKSLELIDGARRNLTEKPQYITESQYVDNLDRTYKMYADTYAFILFKQDKIDEALVYQEKAVGEGKDSEINERYIKFLMAAGNAEKAQKIAAAYIKNNVASTKTKEYFKEAYVINNQSEEGFEEKLASLEKDAHKSALAEIKRQMLNEPATEFILKDLDGNEVSLASLEGKTVVLDFWATWCGPCKASFPGMQKTVEKYKDNANVAFFFVNTMESGMTPQVRNKKVSEFIEQNDYSFHVLLDEPIEKGSRAFKTVDNYGIRGIPTKIIIGPKGNIKFKKVGYGGNNERMLQEIEMMIELAQKSSTIESV